MEPSNKRAEIAGIVFDQIQKLAKVSENAGSVSTLTDIARTISELAMSYGMVSGGSENE